MKFSDRWAYKLAVSAAIPLAFLASGCAQPEGGLADLDPPPVVEPAPNQTYLALGARLIAAREPELAMKAFQTSMVVEGISAQAMTGAGIAAQQQGLLHEARRYLEQASLLAPDSPTVHSNLGVVLLQLTEYHAARDEFRLAFALSSGEDELSARNLNRTQEIIAALEQHPVTDPTISHDVIALGGGEFKLVEAARAEAEAIAE